MLILSRKAGESIVIDGRIQVRVMRVEGEAVKLGVEAPPEMPVHREEIYEEIQRNNQQALTSQSAALPRLPASTGASVSKRAAGPIEARSDK